MSDIAELKQRVDRAVENLRSDAERRRREGQALADKLARLEEKYHARTVELAYCRERIDDLERVNAELQRLVVSMLDFVESDASGDSRQSVHRASATALELVEGWQPPDPDEAADEATNEAAQPEANGEAVSAPDKAAQILAALAYKDVDAEELEIEDLLDPMPEDAPPALTAARAAAETAAPPPETAPTANAATVTEDATAAPPEDLRAEIHIPEPEPTPEAAPTPAQPAPRDADIRALMARLEKAAAQANARAAERTDDDAGNEPGPASRHRAA